MRLFIAVLILAVIGVKTMADSKPISGGTTIVKPSNGPWLADHAASELARYAQAVTGAKAVITTEPASATGDWVVIELAIGKEADSLKSLAGADDPERLRDGFVMRPLGPNRLLIAAAEPIGLLYGVYDYLERFCDVGFFWDGDYIPHLDTLPTENVACAEIPRWPVREVLLWNTFGLAKYHHNFRTLEQREQCFDWMAKRRLNATRHDFASDIARAGSSAVRVFGISDREPDNFTYSGWPGTLDFAADVKTKIIKDEFDYSRKRGIRWFYWVPSGDVPHQWRQTHPECKYLGNLGYSATVLDPSDPVWEPTMTAFLKDIIKTYGTDHLYLNTPMCESMGAGTPESAYEVKLAAAKRLVGMLKSADPDAVWQWDTWDMLVLPNVWTPERKKAYIDAFAGEKTMVYDTAADAVPLYASSDYFSGAKWQFGVLHSYQGDDHLHGNFADYLKRIQNLSNDPKASNCVGINYVPETTGHNLMFADLVARSGWNPDEITVDGFLRDRAVHRYGRAGSARMYGAMKSLVRAVYGGGGRIPIYKKLGKVSGPMEWWPIVGNLMPNIAPEPLYSDIGDLREAVRLGLSCRETQQDNELYAIDMVDWTRTCLAHVFNWSIVDVFKALKRGDVDRIKSSAGIARECLTHIENLLSTRPDFYLQPQIDWVMGVPGTNPYAGWYIKQHCVNDLYSANDVYEQMHWFYRPRVAVYLDEVQRRAEDGVTGIEWGDIEPKCNEIRDRWLNEDIKVPESERFQGGSLDAVAAAYAALERIASTCETGQAPSDPNTREYSLRELGNLE